MGTSWKESVKVAYDQPWRRTFLEWLKYMGTSWKEAVKVAYDRSLWTQPLSTERNPFFFPWNWYVWDSVLSVLFRSTWQQRNVIETISTTKQILAQTYCVTSNWRQTPRLADDNLWFFPRFLFFFSSFLNWSSTVFFFFGGLCLLMSVSCVNKVLFLVLVGDKLVQLITSLI